MLYQYLMDQSIREHPAQVALRAATASHRHAGMQISPDQGQFMALLVKLIGARRTIEVGAFTGYSALTVALAMPDDGGCWPATSRRVHACRPALLMKSRPVTERRIASSDRRRQTPFRAA